MQVLSYCGEDEEDQDINLLSAESYESLGLWSSGGPVAWCASLHCVSATALEIKSPYLYLEKYK